MLVNWEHTASDLNMPGTAVNLNSLKEIKSIFLISSDYAFNTEADFETESVWKNAIGQDYIIPLHNIIEVNDLSEESIYNVSKQDFQYKVSDGKLRYRFKAKYDVSFYQDLRNYAQSYYTVCMYDGNNIYGVLSGSQVIGIDTDFIDVDKLQLQVANTPAWTSVYIEFTNFDNLLVSPITWDAAKLNNIAVVIQNISQTTDITFEVVDSVCGVSIEGLVTADVVITDNINGTAVNSVFTEDGNGYYTIDTDISLYNGTITIFNTDYNGSATYTFSTPQYNPNQYNNSQYNVT